MSDRSNAQIIAEALSTKGWKDQTRGGYWSRMSERIVAALEAEGRLTPAVQGDAKLLQNSDPSEVDQALRERIKPCVDVQGHKFTAFFPPEGQYGFVQTVCERCGMTARDARR